MSEFEGTRFEDLLSRYLDDHLSRSKEAELLAELSDNRKAERFTCITTLQAELSGLSAAQLPDTMMVELVLRDLRGELDPVGEYVTPTLSQVSRCRRYAPLRKLWADYCWYAVAAAACVCLFAGGAWFQHVRQMLVASDSPIPPPKTIASLFPRVSLLQGSAVLVDPSGKVRITEARDLRHGGTLRTIGAASVAAATWPNGSRVVLAGGSELIIKKGVAETRLHVDRGHLRAEVLPETPGHRLVFANPNGEATTNRAAFLWMFENPFSMAVVASGEVRVKRTADDWAISVLQGGYAHVEDDGYFHEWPVSYLPRTLQEEAKALVKIPEGKK